MNTSVSAERSRGGSGRRVVRRLWCRITHRQHWTYDPVLCEEYHVETFWCGRCERRYW